MDPAYVRENPPPKIAKNQVPYETSILGTVRTCWWLEDQAIPGFLSTSVDGKVICYQVISDSVPAFWGP